MPAPKTPARIASSNQTLIRLQTQVRATRMELRGLQERLRELRNVGAREGVGAGAGACACMGWSDTASPDGSARLLQSALDAQNSALAAISRLDALAIAMQRDALTNTPTRALLLDRLQSAITLAQRRGSSTALIFLDVDHFKHINDTLGHAVGDAVLQLVARRLQAAVRDSDAVGRQGGDEFLVLLAEVSKRADAAVIAKKIIADIGAPCVVSGHVLQVAVSVGIAVYPEDASEAQALIRLADAAMYRSKRRGGGSFTFHSDPK